MLYVFVQTVLVTGTHNYLYYDREEMRRCVDNKEEQCFAAIVDRRGSELRAVDAAAITVRPSLHEAVLCAKVFSFKILVTRTLQAEPKITTTR